MRRNAWLRPLPFHFSRLVPKRSGLSVLTASALVLGTAVALTVAAAPASADPGPVASRDQNATVTADALPTVQMDGVAWTQIIVGNTVYVGGSFANARPSGAAAGTNLIPRSNFLAYTLSTGVLNTSFAPSFNGQVKALAVSPDQSTLYVGGDFTTANGSSRSRIAAFNLATGALITTFRPAMGSTVNSIVATNATVYVGGVFTTAAGVARNRLAAFSAASGALLDWNPNADSTVNAMVLTPDGSRLIVGGAFQNVGGGPNYGLAAIDATTGGTLPWAANQTVRNAGTQAAIESLTTDGSAIYGTGYVFGAGGNLEGMFSAAPNTGQINWVESCHGDTYDTYPDPSAGLVYVVSHEHMCSDVGGFGQTDTPWTTHRSTAFTLQATGTAAHDYIGGSYADWYGTPAPSLVGNWLPDFLTGSYTGQGQAAWTVTGNGQYVVEGGEFPAVNSVAQQGLTRFAVKSLATNKQGPRVSGANFVPNVSAASSTAARVTWNTNWDRDDDSLSYTVLRNGVQVYSTTAKSIYWNRPMVGFTDNGLAPGQTYTYAVNATDDDGNVAHGATITYTQPASSPPGLTAYASRVISDGAAPYWPLTESSGTKFFADAAGYQDAVINGSTSSDSSGPIAGTSATSFASASAGATQESTSTIGPNTFSIEAWFKTSGSRGGEIIDFGSAPSGASQTYDRLIYVNNFGRVTFGVQPTTAPGSAPTRSITTNRSYNDGQWHQVVATLSSSGMALYIDGSQRASSNQAAAAQTNYPGYWRVGGDNLNGWPSKPSSTVFSGSLAQVAIYPTALSGATISAHYGLRTSAATNTPPTATFTATPADLAVAFDGSGSSDPDGSIVGYAWDFGDGQTATGATPSHTYAAAGTYTVKLSVTDNGGATASTSQSVTVTAAPVGGTPTTYAADAFDRTTSGGWGSADKGGAWSVTGGASSFSVAAGSGLMSQKAGATTLAALTGLSLTDTDSSVDVALDQVPSGTSVSDYLYVGARRSGTSEYELRVRVLSDASVQATLIKNTAGVAKGLQTVLVTGLTYTVASALHLRFAVTGSSTVTLQGKVWAGSNEPSAWTVSASDASSPLPSGAPSLSAYLVSGTANAPINASWDNLTVRSVGAGIGAPTAAFSSDTSSGLSASFDGSGSSAGAGSTIASYSWDFGDGTPAGSGEQTTHKYSSSGTYNVTLVVTGADGQSDTVTHAVTVTDGAATQLAADAFGRTTTGGWGPADIGGAWTVTGGASAFSVASGVGVMSQKAGATTVAALSGLSLADSDSTVDVSLDKVPSGSSVSDYLYLGARRSGTSEYELRVRVLSDASVQLSLIKNTTGVAKGLQTVTVSGLTYTAATALHLRFAVTGSSTVTLQGKVWAGSNEPSAWTVSASDASSPFPSGAPSLSGFLASGTSNAPIGASWDNLSVQAV